MERNLRDVTKDILQQIADALYEEAERILELARKRVPVKSGALRDSGQVHQPVISGDEISVTISFGSETVMYAIAVHERIQVKHLNGRSKFLESVCLEEASNVDANIAKKIFI